MQIPTGFRETVEQVHGAAGLTWLAALPALINECRARWSLELDQPFENISYNLVFPGRRSDATEIALKVGVPCPELLTEAAALKLFDAQGAVRLLEDDAPRGALLMERVTPGLHIHELLGDVGATRAAAQLMKLLWRTPPEAHTFPSLKVWFRAFVRLRERFDGETGPFPTDLIKRAEMTFADLCASSDREMILHGDLHHANILSSEKSGWLAIDPKGVAGEPGYEIGPFMLNQLPVGADTSATMETLACRLSIFSAELGMTGERLARWAFCYAVLSAIWDFEDSNEWQETIGLAQMLAQLS